MPPIPIDSTTPPPPIVAQPDLMQMELGPKEELEKCHDVLAGASDRASLLRYDQTERAQLGVTSTRSQTQQSFAILRLFQTAPEILPFLDRAQPQRFEKVVGIRLHGAQCRRALRPVIRGLQGAELLLRGQMTADCDWIEDHFTALWSNPATPPEVRLRLQAKMDDPLGQRRLFAETQEQRRTRREHRRQLRLEARHEAQEMKARVGAKDKLRQLGEPKGTRRGS